MSDQSKRSQNPKKGTGKRGIGTTIVGGRPPNLGHHRVKIPAGIQVLVKKAAVDPAFRELLLEKRGEAAREIGLELAPAEATIIESIPRAQLQKTIENTSVPAPERRVFLGKMGTAMVAALGLGLAGCNPEATQTPQATQTPEVVTRVVTVEPVTLGIRPAQCTYNAYRMGWVMDYADAENMLNVVFHPDSPFQYTSWNDTRFRNLVDRAMAELDFGTRMRYWQDAERILVNDYAAVVPIFHYDRTALIRPDIDAMFAPFGAPSIATWTMPAGESTLRVRLDTEPPTLDVNAAADTASGLVVRQLMEGLYTYDANGNIQPAGATSFDVSGDSKTYTIHLREDAVWSDGVPVTAKHYADGLIRLLDPATGAEDAWLMYIVSGAEAFNTGETDDPSTVGIRAVDDLTLEITLERAASFFDTILALSTTYPVRLDVIEQVGELWTEPGNFVGNGAYVLVEWAHDDYIAMDKNLLYHDADSVSIERIELPIIVEDATALAAYERGELDWGAYPSQELPRILEEMPDHLRRTPRPGTYYIGLSTRRAPTNNLNFRRALASSVDKRAILDAVLGMPWRTEACGVIPPEIPGYRGCGNIGFNFDVAAAQSYLAAAMAEMGVEDAGDIEMQLWFNRGNEDVIESVQEQWVTHLGINVAVVNMEWGAYLDTLDRCSN